MPPPKSKGRGRLKDPFHDQKLEQKCTEYLVHSAHVLSDNLRDDYIECVACLELEDPTKPSDKPKIRGKTSREIVAKLKSHLY